MNPKTLATVRVYPDPESPMSHFDFMGELVETSPGKYGIRHHGSIDVITDRWIGYSFERLS